MTDMHLSTQTCAQWHAEAQANPDVFWAERAAELLSWQAPWHRVSDCDFNQAQVRWFIDGKLNVAYNCIDRHLASRADQTAILWIGDIPGQEIKLSYRKLYEDVCRLSNILLDLGVQKGDRVCLYLPMIPEAAIAMLACCRIGAIHSVVFAGFSAEALKDRIIDSGCKLVICADEGRRNGHSIPLKANVDRALKAMGTAPAVLVVEHTGGMIDWYLDRDHHYKTLMQTADAVCPPCIMDAEDPLFILYTSGSTGQPKGILHNTGGYLVYAAMTHKYIFNYQPGQVYWCTADIGWITGHSYVIYGPLCNGATTLMFEGTPTWPKPDRYWQIIDDHQVNIFYTAPTVIRSLMAQGDQWLESSSRSSLQLLGSVGEPINPEAWQWYHRKVGLSASPIVDTWWQTETGGILITPLPGIHPPKPGCATQAFFGVFPELLDDDGKQIVGAGSGQLVISQSWPGQAVSIFGDHARFHATYFSPFPGYYFSGDGARRDSDLDYWITGRIDDVINVSGHRLGTAEIESALVLHPSVAEAAVVGYPHPIKGQGIYAYVTLLAGLDANEALCLELKGQVRDEISAIAIPDIIQWAPALPKTRSGKIMRRILRKIAADDLDDLGDTSTLADPAIVKEIILNRCNQQ